VGDRQPPVDLLGEDARMNPRRRTSALAVVPALAVLLTLTGCSKDPSTPAASAPASHPSATTPVPAPPPPSGACYRLTVASAMQTSDTSPAVPCTRPHTARTVLVGRIAPTPAANPLPMDSARVQRTIAARCRARVDDYIGGSREDQRLSRVQAVWFSPPPSAGAATSATPGGARWFRCDVVIGSGTRTFAPLPHRTKGLLARPGALDRYGTCGTAAPGSATFQRVLCSARHTWRARATIALPAHSRYLSRSAGKDADSRCHDVEASRAVDTLRLRWSFEWPTRAQWNGGQRYGLCWTPDP
jgi:hypothetical protein